MKKHITPIILTISILSITIGLIESNDNYGEFSQIRTLEIILLSTGFIGLVYKVLSIIIWTYSLIKKNCDFIQYHTYITLLYGYLYNWHLLANEPSGKFDLRLFFTWCFSFKMVVFLTINLIIYLLINCQKKNQNQV